jgi:hypothetical protein
MSTRPEPSAPPAPDPNQPPSGTVQPIRLTDPRTGNEEQYDGSVSPAWMVTGLLSGAAFGATLGGPAGAMVGAVVGAVSAHHLPLRVQADRPSRCQLLLTPPTPSPLLSTHLLSLSRWADWWVGERCNEQNSVATLL